MQPILLILHILVAIGIVALVLVQHGKGADVGAAFGAGASNTMFGSQGSTPFLVKLTGLFAFIFFATSVVLSYLAGHMQQTTNQILAQQQTQQVQQAPAQNSNVVLNIPAQSQGKDKE